jgi:phenylpyruvate tautomerase PptA (4-oxalocrotonate tautomerase family)
MPLYQIYHAVPLSNQQQDELAEAITTLHTTKFGVLRLFVNVWFSDVSAQNTYTAGKRRKGNHIRASVRLGQRTHEDFRQLCRSIEEAWDRIVYQPIKRITVNATELKQFELHTLILGSSNPVGLEAGFELPVAGSDGDWLRRNWSQFQQKARDGEEEFVDLVKDVEERALLSR